jgi:hypothetical protein
MRGTVCTCLKIAYNILQVKQDGNEDLNVIQLVSVKFPEFLAAIKLLRIAFLRFQFDKQMCYLILLPQRYFENTKK